MYSIYLNIGKTQVKTTMRYCYILNKKGYNFQHIISKNWWKQTLSSGFWSQGKRVQSRHYHLASDLRGKEFSLSSDIYKVCIFLRRLLSGWGSSLLFWDCWVFLSRWKLLIFFSTLVEMIIWGFFLCSIKVMYYSAWFLYDELPLNSWDKFHLVIVSNLLNLLLYLVCLNIHCKDWCWNWSSNIFATWNEARTHWKSLWCWERLRAGGEGGNRG